MAYQYRNNGRNGNGCGCQGENGGGRGNRDGNYPAGGRFGEGRTNGGHRGDGRMSSGIMNEGKNTDCGCAGNGNAGGRQGIFGFVGSDGPVAPIPQDVALAMAYVPVQPWGEIYEPDKALQRGTIFADLDKPFLGEKAGCRK